MKAEQSRAPYYIKLHLGDYERDCVELSPLQDGMYFRLMRWYYSTGKPIPNDIERIYRRVHALSVDEQNAVKYVLENFFLLDGPVWRQRRIDQEIAEWYERSDAGKESAERRWKKSNEIKESSYAKALPTQYEGNANQNQNQNQNHKTLNTLLGKPNDTPTKVIKNPETQKAACRVLEFLNEKTGRAYRPTESNLGFIVARLKEGASEADCRMVIARQCSKWRGDSEMETYLRPATLFNRTKFDQYVGECVIRHEQT